MQVSCLGRDVMLRRREFMLIILTRHRLAETLFPMLVFRLSLFFRHISQLIDDRAWRWAHWVLFRCVGDSECEQRSRQPYALWICISSGHRWSDDLGFIGWSGWRFGSTVRLQLTVHMLERISRKLGHRQVRQCSVFVAAANLEHLKSLRSENG